MWWQLETKFLYMYIKEFSVVNNNKKLRLFSGPFFVGPKEKERWSTSGRSIRLAPETLTYWNEE